MAATRKKKASAVPKQHRKRKPVWDVNIPVVKDAAEAKMLLKRAERSLSLYYKKYPPPPRCSPSADFEPTF